MYGVARPVVVFSLTAAIGVAALQLGTWAAHKDPQIAGLTGLAGGIAGGQSLLPGFGMSASNAYRLQDLGILSSVLYHVEESYVEPGRVDFDAMYTESLRAVSRRVPVVMFRREPGGQLLHVEAGDARTVLQVPPIDSRKKLISELQRVAQILESNLQASDIPMDEEDGGQPFAQIEYAMANGVLDTLDPHSRLLPPEASRQMDVDNAGEFGGLGITLIDRSGKLTVEYPLPGTPAEAQGIRADDQIVRIDGVSTINMSIDEAVSRLRGVIGAPVTIQILREGLNEPQEITLVRAKIRLNEVEGQLLSGGIGYVSIQSFHANVEEQLVPLLARLDQEAGGRMKGLILDLRDNPGGYLHQAEKVADLFLDRGTIVSQVDATGRKLEEYNARATGVEPKYPIAVLTSAGSASASEIVSGALRNNERAIIIGERTYGKGSVQNLKDFDDGSKLKLTISKYLTPGDRSIQAVGIPADIEVQPAFVERKTTDGKSTDIAVLFARERVKREADADKHLEQSQIQPEPPAYRIRRLKPSEARRRTSAKLDVSGDFEVGVAREVLLAAPSPRRADVLAAASPVVDRYARQGDLDVTRAFSSLGVDWSDGPDAKGADLAVSFDLGPDGKLVAGVEEKVALSVTNRGQEPIYRLTAIADFEGDYGSREFAFGKLMPGETRRWEQPFQLDVGHPTELTPVTFRFRDASGSEIAAEHARLPVQGQALPRLVWQAAMEDAGDGDGTLEAGEKVRVTLTVRNEGEGPTVEAFAQLKNQSGRALDVLRGVVEPGVMRAADGSACAVLEAGVDGGNIVGDASTATERVNRGDPPKYAEGCKRSLAAGESWTGSFELLVKEAAPDLKLKLTVGDAEAYDHGAVMRAGFYTFFTNHQDIAFQAGKPAPVIPPGVPPEVKVTQAPGVVLDRDRATISGEVTDLQGLSHVEIYLGEDKVFFQGAPRGGSLQSIPFTADLELKPGVNTVAILATDKDGLTDTASVATFYVAPELQAQVGEIGKDAPELKRP